MKSVVYRIGDLELRRVKTINKEYYLEIVEWYKEDICYTILTFKEDEEGWDIKSVGDRILVSEKKWNDLRILIKFGFEFLNKESKEDEE